MHHTVTDVDVYSLVRRVQMTEADTHMGCTILTNAALTESTKHSSDIVTRDLA